MRRCCDIMSLALQALPKDEKAGKIHWRQVSSAYKGLPPATHLAVLRKGHPFKTARTGPCRQHAQPTGSPTAGGNTVDLHLTSLSGLQMAKEDDSALHSWLRWLDRLLVHLLFNIVW